MGELSLYMASVSAVEYCGWGKLEVFKNDTKTDDIFLNRTEFTIGRKSTCDHFLTDNPYLSGVHARFSYNTETNSAQLTDVSANGILLNGVRIGKNNQVDIHDGDKITLVLKDSSHELNLHLRLILLPVYDKNLIEETSSISEEKISLVESDEEPKLPKEDLAVKDDDDDCIVKEKPVHFEEETTLSAITDTGGKKSESISSKQIEVLKKAGYKELPSLHKSESFEEQLLCGVCQEIMHMAVSLQPCMHSYCAGCYSEWMDISRDCPACRAVVDRIAKNHLVNNLIETYLKSNPEKRRNPDDLAELDKKNKITDELLYPPKKRALGGLYTEDEEYYSPSDDEYIPVPTYFPTLTTVTPFSTALFPIPGIFTKCRQCPGFLGLPPITTTIAVVTPSPYVCPFASPAHLICTCCCQPMPDRSTCTDTTVPPQHCDVCKNAYCHMYWGCWGMSCKGCLNEFKNFAFEPAVMATIVINSSTESNVLNIYLAKKKIGVREMLAQCLEKLDKGEYKCTDSRSTLISGKTRICYACALKNFKDLAFLYRKDIPKEDMPDNIANRSDCYYGSACKTQFHKPLHATNFNHACDQTRFT